MLSISVKSSIESAEEMSTKQNLIDAIYFCQIPELTICRRNFEQTKISWFDAIFLCEILERIGRRNVNKQDLTEAMYLCEILERIRRTNVEETRSQWCHIFLSNPRTNNL
jgi:hypothetical protein